MRGGGDERAEIHRERVRTRDDAGTTRYRTREGGNEKERQGGAVEGAFRG